MKVTSGQVDHTHLKPGLHLLETILVGNTYLYSYDLRFIRPIQTSKDKDKVLTQGQVHTIEHLLAYHLRVNATHPSQIISIFPYGCLTGFGCISTLDVPLFSKVLHKTLDVVDSFTEIPFSTVERCGNCFINDLEGAKRALKSFAKIFNAQMLSDIMVLPLLDVK